MKKMISILLAAVLLAGCSSVKKIDVATLNTLDVTTTKADMSGYELLSDENHVFQEISIEDSNRIYGEGKDAVIYYGYAGCGFCQQAVPVLNDAAKSMGVSVYYANLESKIADETYNELMGYISQHLENGEFYVPQVFVVKGGEIVGGHLSLIPSYDISRGENMNSSQKKELQNIYTDLIEKLR